MVKWNTVNILINILNMKLLYTILCLIVFSVVVVADPIATSEVLEEVKNSSVLELGIKEYVKDILKEIISDFALTTVNITNLTDNTRIINVTEYRNITNINTGIASAVSLIPLFTSGAISATTGTVVALKCASGTMGMYNLIHTIGCFSLIGTTATFGGTFVQIFSSYGLNLDSATLITVAITVIPSAICFY